MKHFFHVHMKNSLVRYWFIYGNIHSLSFSKLASYFHKLLLKVMLILSDPVCFALGVLIRSQAPFTSNWSALYRGCGSPVMSWILLKANNGQQASGVGDKRFFRFKRNAYHLWTAIIRHRLNDITHQQIMHFNQGSKFAIIFKEWTLKIFANFDPWLKCMICWCVISLRRCRTMAVLNKHPQIFGTLAQPSHFLSNIPVMTQRILTGPTNVEWLWVNDFSPNEYHIWHRWPSICWHVEN